MEEEVVGGLGESGRVKSVHSKGFKWIGLASIIGFVFFILGVLGFILDLAGVEVVSFFTGVLGWVLIIGFLFLSLFFYYGFVKLGEYAKSGLLKFCGWSFIVLIFVFVIFGVVGYFVSPPTGLMEGVGGLGGINQQIDIGDININQKIGAGGINQQIDFGGLTGRAVSGLGGISSSGGLNWILFSLIVLALLYLNMVMYLFSVALIKLKEIKFSTVAGIFGLILSILLTGVILIILYVVINPMALFSFLYGLAFNPGAYESVLKMIQVFGYGFNILGILFALFLALTLSSGSKKFE